MSVLVPIRRMTPPSRERNRLRSDEEPAVGAVGATNLKFRLVDFASLKGPRPSLRGLWQVVGVHESRPSRTFEFAVLCAGVGINLLVEPVECTV